MFLFGFIVQPWVLISRVSNNLYLDVSIYVFLMIMSYFMTFYFCGENNGIATRQFFGMFFVIIGLVLLSTGVIK